MDQIIALLEQFAKMVPIEVFSMAGSFLEELIAPIPSPFVMTTVGAIAQAQGLLLPRITIVVLVGAIAKTFASWLIYLIADKAEDLIIGKFGKFFGVTTGNIERVGELFTNRWSLWLIALARATPFMSTSIVSVGCGVIKTPLKAYLIGTFIGSIFRNFFFVYIGLFGASHLLDFAEVSTPVKIVILGLIVVGIFVAYRVKGHVSDKILDKKTSEVKKTD